MRAVPRSLQVRLLFGGWATRFGWWWVAALSWICVGAYSSQPTVHYRNTMAKVTRVDDTTVDGHRAYIVERTSRGWNGSPGAVITVEGTRPELGSETPTSEPDLRLEPPNPGALLFACAGFLFMLFEVPAEVRKLRRLRDPDVIPMPEGALTRWIGPDGQLAGDWTAWLLLVPPIAALVGLGWFIALF